MKLGLLRDRRASAHRAALLEAVVHLLRDWGAEADCIIAGDPRLPVAHDVYVVAGDARATLDVATDIAQRGGLLLDGAQALGAVRHRRATLLRLEAAGVPVAAPFSAPGHVHRLDCVGGQVFGTERSGPSRRREVLVTLGADLRHVALRCADVLEMTLLSVDVAVDGSRVAVVKVRPFPSLRGVPDAALRLADFLYASALRLVTGGARGRHSLP